MSSSHIMKYLINIGSVNKLPQYYQDAYQDLYDNHNIKAIIFFDESKIEWDLQKDTEAWTIKTYTSTKDLTKQILHIPKEEVYYINTFDEKLIPITEQIKKDIWLIHTQHPEIFRDKSLQRKMLLEQYPETTIQYKKIDIENINEEELYEFPFIIKPTAGVQSAWVAKINNKQELKKYQNTAQILQKNLLERWIQDTQYIIEEFIDGEMYTVDYFVDNHGKHTETPITHVTLAKSFGVDDFANCMISSGTHVQHIDQKKISTFIQKHIQTFKLKNIYIHHEFKITPSWEMKTIELNGRIGWFRMEMMKELYQINMLSIATKDNIKIKKWSYLVSILYPKREGIFHGYDEKITTIYKKLPSLLSINLTKNKIWKKVWYTQNGYTHLWTIKIISNNQEQFLADLETIKKHYNDFTIIE